MTDFTELHFTVASTLGGTNHSIGFHVREQDWDEVQRELERTDPQRLIKYRTEPRPRDRKLDHSWMFVWIIVHELCPIKALLYLASISTGPTALIKLKPDEFP